MTLVQNDRRELVVPFEAPLLAPTSVERRPARPARPRDIGYDDGYDEGLRAAEAEMSAVLDQHRRATDRLVRAAIALEDAARDLARRDALSLAEIEDDVVALAVALATEVVGRELSVTDEPVVDAMARASRLVPDRGVARVRVNADDVAAAQSVIEDETTPFSDEVEIVGDPAVEPGDCVVEIGECRIDAGVGAALERIAAVLR
ncbi:MAG: FliH/SctL family protein [Ilumatobacter sp.]|uniref:FliH/SctL family protein n=1 Tax=Ilumatobacter sp. TaxID=1967498 RepID=UPI00262F8AF2|nr:FliH/SctL family protein [Ilumatobacter sp.]MDJ0767453.1 FliH/SctL family protein [Ilumatobacter sp.]